MSTTKIPLGRFKKALRLTSISGLARDLNSIFVNPEYSDVVFKITTPSDNEVEDGEDSVALEESESIENKTKLYAHKSILISRSPVFKAMLLTSGMEEAKAKGVLEVPITGTSPHAFHDMLFHLYTGSLAHIEAGRAVEVYLLAGQYGLTILADYCASLIKNGISEENVVDILSWSKGTDQTVIVQYCCAFIKSQFESFVEKNKFEDIPYGIVHQLIKDDVLFNETSEYKLARLVESWIKKNQVGIATKSTHGGQGGEVSVLTSEDVQELIKCIRYGVMNVDELHELEENSIYPQKLLYEVYKYNLFQQQLQSGTNITKKREEVFPDAVLYKRFECRVAKVLTSVGNELIFVYKSDFDYNGIVGYFGRDQGKSQQFTNPHTKGFITATSSSVFSNAGPEYALSYGATNFWSSSAPNQWITFDFKKYAVRPTHYTLKMVLDYDSFALRTWKFQGSSDGGNTWQDLMSHVNDASLTTRGTTATWKLPPVSQFFSLFRIQNCGTDSQGTEYIGISGFEVYGSMTEVQE